MPSKSALLLVTLTLGACTNVPSSPPAAVDSLPGPVPVNDPAPTLAPASPSLSCASLAEFKDTWTPEDSFNRMRDCLAKGDVDKAADLDTLAVIYGNYDTWRVVDEDVKNGFTVLTYLTYQNLSDAQRHDLALASTRRTAKGSASVKALCQGVLQIGPPAYIPLYMTKYRVDDTGRSVRVPQATQVDQSPTFDIPRQWQQAVDAVLHCGKS